MGRETYMNLYEGLKTHQTMSSSHGLGTSTTTCSTLASSTAVNAGNALKHIRQAIDCEERGYILEAMEQYDKGIYHLYEHISTEKAAQALCTKCLESYKLRLNHLRQCVLENILEAKLVRHCCIPKDASGYGYYRLFKEYLTDDVREVHLYEPHLSEHMHMRNLINFLELLAKNCRTLKYIRLFTMIDMKMPIYQMRALQKISENLMNGHIQMNFSFEKHMDCARVILSSGVLFKLGRGLHYFKNNSFFYNLGLCDYDFRYCLQTEYEVWQSKPFFAKLKSKENRASKVKHLLHTNRSSVMV